MSRIKTIGICLKLFSARLRELSISCRVTGSRFWLIVLLGGLLGPACAPLLRLGGSIEGFEFRGLEFDNIRFKPIGLELEVEGEVAGTTISVPPVPALSYWLRRGDMMEARWDTFESHWQRDGASCSFVDNTPTADCQICNWCDLQPSTPPRLCDDLAEIQVTQLINLYLYPGFMDTDPQLIFFVGGGQIPRGDFITICQASPRSFEPPSNGLYRLQGPLDPEGSKALTFKGETNSEIKLRVVEPGQPQHAYYKLTPKEVDSKIYWTFTMEGDPLWLENFSPNLRVTDIRIFRSPCGDGAAESGICATPDTNDWVKPSRVLFLPNFQNTVSGHSDEPLNRCYSKPTATDGKFINLDTCRQRYDYPLNQTVPRPATPTYDKNPDNPRPSRKLTWLVEFNTAEGADTIPAGVEELVIEFTIQAEN